MAWAGVIGGIVGAATALWSAYEQKKQMKVQNKLAKQQYQATKRAYELEEQERNKVNQQEADTESLLEQSTEAGEATNLTLADRKKTNKNMFNRKAGALGSLGTYDDE